MVASRRRLTAVFVFLVALAAFPILASAATADFRVLIDNLPDVGCNEGGMTGVDTILVTRVVTTDTSAQETRIYRQVCTAGVFGPPVDLDLTVRPAGLSTPSGLVLLETRIPYSAVPGIETRSIRLGFDATDGFFTQHVLTLPNGSPIMIPPTVGRRHSANTPGTRNFVLDGNGNDWTNISPLVTGMASDGANAIRMLRIFAAANTADDFIYFRFDSFVDNSGPFAQDDSFARKSGQGLSVNPPGVLGNDGDPNGKPLTATPVSSPSHGSVILNPDGSFTYTPDNPTSDTSDKFNYKANNGTKDSNVAEVTIKVSNKNSSAPIANDDSYNTPEDTPLNVAAPGVLANDVDPDGPTLTATLLTNPVHGSVVLSSNGAFTYNPAHNFFGTDTFTYRVSDGTSNDDATVTITISSVNDAPVAQNINRTTNEDTSVSVTLSATDPEGGSLTWQIVTPPANGSLSGVAPNLTYTPNPNFFGSDSFTYTAKDSLNKVSNTATVTITVNPVNDAPSFSCGPNVIADSSLGAASFPGWATGISAGPANESGQTLTSEVTANSNPGLFTVQPSFNAAGTLTFTPVAGATGTANITIRLRDNGGTANGGVDVSGTCSFTINVDASPSVISTTPTNGATGVAGSANVVVNFSEPVNASGASFDITCATSGAHTFSTSASPSATFTLDPTADFTGGETCTVTVFAAGVTDVDANDPPNNMAANYVFSFTIDTAPSVSSTTPANGATNIGAATNIAINFSEPVNASGASFDITCATSGAHTFTTSASPSAAFTLNPNTDFTAGETCTVTVFAAGVTDADANDPPDNMLANYVFSFTIDAAPSVSAVTPVNGAVNVAANTNLSITFSEPVTITNSSVTISCANTGAHTVSVSGGPTTWTVDPTSDFGNGELCTATVLAAQVSDNDANDPPDNMLANFVWSFTTDNPPSVTATTPVNASTTSPDTDVTVTFDEAVNATTSSFTISCTTSGAHTFALSGGPTTFTLNPTTDFTGGETCTVTVVAGQVTDQDAGDPPDNMVANYVFSFSIDAAPAVTSTTPTNGATQVAGNSDVTINFSESVNASGASFDITCATSGAHTFTTSASPSTTFTLNPNTDFTAGETCTVTVFAAGVTDVDANDPPDNMAANYVFSFTVDAAPSVSSTTPTNGATDIGAATNITINFSESVNASGASFDITCATSGAHTFTTSASPSTTFTLNPNTDFTAGETCTVTVFAAGVTDADAFDPPDNMLANYVFSFTIDAAPSVTAVTPTDTSTGIATNTNLSITFSEPVTITNSSVTISCANTGAHTVTVSGGPTTWTVDPTSDFGNGELCTATVLAAQVSDNDANDPPDNMLANFVWSFTTDNPPSVLTTTPTNGGGTSPSSNISITFDEAVNATTSSFTISCTTSGSHAFGLSGGPTTFTLDPTVDFTAGENCTVTVLAAQVTDQDAGDPPDNMVANYVFSFGIDAAPFVVSTSPNNGDTNKATDVNIVITYSEPVTASGTAYKLTCTPSATARTFVLSGNGTAVHTLDPNINLSAGQTCTVAITAAQISDVDAFDPPDNMAADYSFSFTTDANPQIIALSPNDGSIIATNANTNITWTEPVTMTTVQISCTVSGSHTSVLSTSDNITWTVNPDTDYTQGESCTITVFSASVTDIDTNDPPDNPGPDISWTYTVDTAPAVNSVTPTDTSTGIATNTNLSITFSEAVTITNSSVTLSCANSGAHTVTVSGGPTTWTVDPDTDLGNGELCTATVLAAQVSDNDTADPPDNLAANYVWSFTTDNPPSVQSTTPTNGGTTSTTGNITITFDESVNASASSFSISCNTSGAHSYVLSGGPTTWTLDPDTDFTAGESCTVTVVAAQVTDTDAGDPPDNMVSDYQFTINVDAPPSVVSTTPANSPTPDQASNVNIVITYSEPVNASGTAYTIKCTPSNTARPFVLSGNGTAVHTLDPNTNLPAGQTCTVAILASQITDTDTNDPPDNMTADYSFAFHVDANPQIISTSPTDGSTVATNTNIGMTWTEPVTMTTININCTVSGAHTSSLSTSDNITWTADPTTDFTPGESCTITVLSASVTDIDTADPPDNPGPDVSWTYTVDTAPTVTATTPTDLATQQANNANISITFSEGVNATTSSFTISCVTSGAHTFALSGGPTTWTLDPNTDFTNGEQCTVTVVANQISDTDTADPPDTMAANYVFTFTVDTPPSVTTTTPVNGATGVTPTSTITVNFNESVNATTSSFTINCGGNQPYTLSASPSTSFTLTPTSNLPAVLCTVTVIAAQITDADAGDPPDNMVADYVFSFTVNTPPTANDDVDNAIGNLTLVVPDNDGVLVNGADGSGADTDPDPGATLAVQGLGPFTGSAGGTITFTPGGGYTYHSQAGDQNVDDVFTYTVVDNNGATDTGQLTIHVGPRYLFVDANFGGAPNDGRDTNPFKTLQQAEAGSAVNDTFVVKQGSYNTSNDFILLKNGQVLYGDGASANLTTTFNTENFTILVPTGTHPSFKRSTAGNTITLASGNTLRGIDVSASSGGAAISGTNFGTLTVTESRIGVGQTNPAPALVLTNGTLAATFQTVNSTAGANGISCTTCAGTLTVSGGTLTGAAGDEFLITGSAPTVNVTFSGNITYAGAANAIHIATTSGTYNGNVTFNTGALNVTGGTAINISATAAGSAGTHNYYTTSGTASISGAATGINLGTNADGTYNFGPAATPANFAITNTTAAAFIINGNLAKVTYNGNMTQTTAQTMVSITSQGATGSTTFQNGTLNASAGSGVSLSNADGPVNFNGTMSLSNAAGVSIVAGSGGAISFGSNTTITSTGTPFVVDGSGGNAPAVNGTITYSGTINKTSTGTLFNVNTLSGSLTFNGSTLSGSEATTGVTATLANISGTFTANHLNINDSNATLGATTLLSISGANTGTMNFHHLTLSANGGATARGAGIVASGGGTLNITNTGGNSSITTRDAVGISLNGQALTNGSNLNSLTVAGGANTANAVQMTNVTNGTFTIAGGSIAGATGTTFDVSGGSASVTFGGTVTQANSAAAISVAGGHSGTLTFSNTVSATNGSGLQFDNADGTYNLNGTTTMNGGNAGVDILNGSGGTFSFSSNTAITSPTGTAFHVAASSPNITYSGTITQNTAGQRAIDYTTLGGGTSTFSGAVGSTGGNGVSIEGTGGTVDISGQLTLSGAASVYKACSGTCAAPSGTGLTISVSNANNTVGSPTAATTAGVTINRAQIGASGVQFDTVNVTGGTNGILLSNTGNTAGFTINGTGGADSGGTLSGQTGDAISITSVRSVTLNQMQITNAGDNGIDATTVTNGLTIDSCDFATSGGSGIKANTITDFKYQNGSTMTGAGNAANEYGIELTDMFGANNVVSSSSVTGSAVINLFVTNNSSTAGTLAITNSTLNNTAAATGGDGVSIVGNNSANLTVSLTGANNLNTNQGDGIQVSANNSSTISVTVDGATSNYNQNLGSAVNIAAANTANITASVSGFTGVSTGTSSANGLNVINIQNFDTSTINAKVFSNTITGLGNNAAGIRVIQEGNGTINAELKSNNISGMAAEGVRAQARAGTGGSGTLNLTVGGAGAGNTVNDAVGFPLDGISIESGSSAGGDTNTVCLNMLNNNSSANAEQGYRLRQRTGTVFRLQNFGTSPCGANGANSADVTCWVNTTKTNTGTTDIVIGTAFTVAPSNCPTPP